VKDTLEVLTPPIQSKTDRSYLDTCLSHYKNARKSLDFETAGIGITNLLAQLMQEKGIPEEEVRSRFYAIDRYGLVAEKSKDVRPEQLPYARKEQEVQDWRQPNGKITLLDVIRHAKPSVLIGVSGQTGAFTEDAVREMAKNAIRPVIFPLSNPTSRSEATPQDLLDRTEGRALIGTGSPFEPMNLGGKKVHIDQTNNLRAVICRS
jgi:malate dehydrogenase (oxaloacetate-decarboxylating)